MQIYKPIISPQITETCPRKPMETHLHSFHSNRSGYSKQRMEVAGKLNIYISNTPFMNLTCMRIIGFSSFIITSDKRYWKMTPAVGQSRRVCACLWCSTSVTTLRWLPWRGIYTKENKIATYGWTIPTTGPTKPRAGQRKSWTTIIRDLCSAHRCTPSI